MQTDRTCSSSAPIASSAAAILAANCGQVSTTNGSSTAAAESSDPVVVLCNQWVKAVREDPEEWWQVVEAETKRIARVLWDARQAFGKAQCELGGGDLQ